MDINKPLKIMISAPSLRTKPLRCVVTGRQLTPSCPLEQYRIRSIRTRAMKAVEQVSTMEMRRIAIRVTLLRNRRRYEALRTKSVLVVKMGLV